MRFMESPENREATELRLSLPGTDSRPATLRGTKRAIAGNEEWCQPSRRSEGKERDGLSQPAVGWPPVRSLNRRLKKSVHGGAGIFVKVSMDGAPYLRKIDLNIYKGYEDLKAGVEGMFKCFILGKKNGISGDGCDWSDYVMAFEDKDGDWMMVGDVPWEMFITSCKRLRVMKGSEAIGSDRS